MKTIMRSNCAWQSFVWQRRGGGSICFSFGMFWAMAWAHSYKSQSWFSGFINGYLE